MRPAWHGVKVGDRVRVCRGGIGRQTLDDIESGWWTVTSVPRCAGVATALRIVGVARRSNSRQGRSVWLTDIIERRSR